MNKKTYQSGGMVGVEYSADAASSPTTVESVARVVPNQIILALALCTENAVAELKLDVDPQRGRMAAHAIPAMRQMALVVRDLAWQMGREKFVDGAAAANMVLNQPIITSADQQESSSDHKEIVDMATEPEKTLAAILRGLDHYEAFYDGEAYLSHEGDVVSIMSWALDLSREFISSVAPEASVEANLTAASMEIMDVLNENIHANQSYEFLTSLLKSSAEKVEAAAPSTALLIRMVAETEESLLFYRDKYNSRTVSKTTFDALERARSEIEQLLKH